MPHIGVKRLRTCHCQHDRTHSDECAETIDPEKVDRVQRVQRCENNLRPFDQVDETERRKRGEIHQHNRSEQRPDLCRAARLDRKQPDQDADGYRDNPRLETGVDVTQPFGGGQHRHRRCNHRIAIKQRGRKHPEHDDRRGPALTLGLPVDQRKQGETATLPLVISAHNDHRIFEGHDDHHRPEYQAQHTVNVQRVGVYRMMTSKGFAESVNRAGTDIAKDDPDCADRQLRQ